MLPEERSAICPLCGRSYDRVRRGQLFCSDGCARLARRGRPLLAARRRELKRCEVCGGAFEAGGAVSSRRKRFCSRACIAAGRGSAIRPLTLTETDAAYIAAFIDGEGSIVRSRRAPHPWRLQVGQKEPAVIYWLREVTGVGTVYREANPGRGLVRRRAYDDIHRWTVSGWAAADLLRQVLPFMHVKRSRAQEMLTRYEWPQAELERSGE